MTPGKVVRRLLLTQLIDAFPQQRNQNIVGKLSKLPEHHKPNELRSAFKSWRRA